MKLSVSFPFLVQTSHEMRQQHPATSHSPPPRHQTSTMNTDSPASRKNSNVRPMHVIQRDISLREVDRTDRHRTGGRGVTCMKDFVTWRRTVQIWKSEAVGEHGSK